MKTWRRRMTFRKKGDNPYTDPVYRPGATLANLCSPGVGTSVRIMLESDWKRIEQEFRKAGFVGDDLGLGMRNLRALFDHARAAKGL